MRVSEHINLKDWKSPKRKRAVSSKITRWERANRKKACWADRGKLQRVIYKLLVNIST
jgi:hypothetical protein